MASPALPTAPSGRDAETFTFGVQQENYDKKHTFPGPLGRATHGSPAPAYGEALALGERVTGIPRGSRADYSGRPGNRRVCCMLIDKTRGLTPAASLAVIAAVLAVAGAAHAADSSAPPSDRNLVTDTYHGVQVSDPYRWLEDSANPKVHDWSVAENKRTRQYLDALPQRDRIYRQLAAQISATSSSFHGLYAAGGQVFALYDEPPKQQPMIALLTNAAARGHVMLQEKQLKFHIERYGNIAHVWSSYALDSDGKQIARGINSIQAIKEAGGLRVVGIVVQAESAIAPLPKKYLP
jgi:hypothetical protein